MPKLLLVLILLISCSDSKNSDSEKNHALKQETTVAEFQSILDAAKVKGGVLIYDLLGDTYYSNDFEWAKQGKLPASTFKIANSIIALETTDIANDSTLFEWAGEDRNFDVWEQDLPFRQAFRYSCVPCYQEVARDIGAEKMSHYLDKLEYRNMDVDTSNIDMFWLVGESRINQFQQIDFLKRFYQSELPISSRTELIVKSMMVLDENEEYKLSGKTGWSINNEVNNGWFVGFIEAQNNTYFFATNVEPTEDFDMNLFASIRQEVTYNALKQMKVIGE